MDKRLQMLAVAAMLAGTAALADDLLDGVLDWDAPVMRTPATREAPVAAPERPPARSTPRPQAAPVRREAAPAAEPRESIREERLRQRLEDAERRAAEAESALSRRDARGGYVSMWADQSDDDNDGGGLIAGEIERMPRLSIGVGKGSGNTTDAQADFVLPLWESQFDLAVRASYLSWNYEWDYYVRRWRSWGSPYEHVEVDLKTTIAEALALWRPLRGEMFSPYAGLGGRYWATRKKYDDWDFSNSDNGKLELGWRLGLTWNCERFWLGGEYAGGKARSDFAATAGFRCTRNLSLQAFVSRYEVSFEDYAHGDGKKSRDGVAAGGGLAWAF